MRSLRHFNAGYVFKDGACLPCLSTENPATKVLSGLSEMGNAVLLTPKDVKP